MYTSHHLQRGAYCVSPHSLFMKTFLFQAIMAHKNTSQTHRTAEEEKEEKLKRIKHIKHIYTKKLSRILTV